ncbi:MAG: DUF3105 domain-containing protein [Chloroflexota bacterium]|nr:DUF3105 domain-containing protein [Chloroflexota bacterium]
MARKRRRGAKEPAPANQQAPRADISAGNAKARQTARPQRGTRRSNYAWYRRVPWVAVGAGAVLLVGAFLIARQFGFFESAGRYVAGGGVGDHVPVGQSITYPSYPPTSGQHASSPATWGAHTEPVLDELAVHNLEHGGVVVSYNNISADDLAKVRALLTSYPKDQYGEVKLLIRPYDKVAPGTIVLTAWNWIDELPSYDAARVKAFMDAHLNKCCEQVR